MKEQHESSAKKPYEAPKLEIILFSAEDIIVSSQGDMGPAPIQ